MARDLKRSASQAELPDQHVQIWIQVPPDRCTGGQHLSLRVTVSRSDPIDELKRSLQQAICSRTAMFPRVNCFRLLQHNSHVLA